MSNFQYDISSALKTIDRWQQIIIRNTEGLLQAGYNNTDVTFGQTPGVTLANGQTPTTSSGGTSPKSGGGDTVTISSTALDFEQGQIDPAGSPTSLAIRGTGFFLLAENLKPGARLFLTRAGDFHYDASGHLVNPAGLFVVGGSGVLTDPPTPVTNPGDGTVDMTTLTLGNVSVRSQLAISGYGVTVYQTSNTSGPIQSFANGRAEVGFVQASSIETPSRIGASAALEFQTNTALQTYKIFKDMLDDFNKTTDDALSLVK